jgi:hypothetical protein
MGPQRRHPGDAGTIRRSLDSFNVLVRPDALAVRSGRLSTLRFPNARTANGIPDTNVRDPNGAERYDIELEVVRNRLPHLFRPDFSNPRLWGQIQSDGVVKLTGYHMANESWESVFEQVTPTNLSSWTR